MNLSISNIGWDTEQDETLYSLMKEYGFNGLEIAPTRSFGGQPYNKIEEAKKWRDWLKDKYGFIISSMQSIWYGRSEKLFGTEDERNFLLDYTRKAIDFAAAIQCGNLVFGCPVNRYLPEGVNADIAIDFFKTLGDYAAEKGTAIGMEANPLIYKTNYINDTLSAIELIRKVNSKGFMLNLDAGTMIQNEEPLEELAGKVQYINHVHISEPGLKPLKKRKMHKQLKKLLDAEGYQKFISIEMGNVGDMDILKECMEYVRSIINE